MEFNNTLIVIVIPIVVAVIAFILGWVLHSKIGKNKIATANETAKKIIEDAEKESKNLKREKLLEVKDEWLRKKQEFDNEVNTRRQKLQNYEKKIESR